MLGYRSNIAGLRKSSRARLAKRSRAGFRPSTLECLEDRLVLVTASLSLAAVTGSYGGQVDLQATLTSGGQPLSGKSIEFIEGQMFSQDFTYLGPMTTNAEGVATFTDVSLVGLDAGTYIGEFTANFPTDGTYDGTNTSADLRVTPAPLTITESDQSKVYGQLDPSFTGSVFGALNGDSITPVVSTSAGQYGNVTPGGYSINLAGLAGPKAFDYSTSVSGGSYTPGTLTVTPAPLSVTADSTSKVYGQANPALNGTTTGILNGDDVSPVLVTAAAQYSDVNGYPIQMNGLAGEKAMDYSTVVAGGSFTLGTLDITPASLTISPDDATKVYGAATPTLTGVTTGVLNSDDVSPVFTASASQFSDVTANGYPINLIGLTGPKAMDYAAFANPMDPTGTLTVTPAPVRVLGGDYEKVYGQLNPAFVNYTIQGLLNSDGVSANLATAATQYSDVTGGNYFSVDLVSLAGPKAEDYSATSGGGSVIPGIFFITPAPLTVTPSNTAKVYGQENPTLTGSTSGILNGDDVSPVFSTSAGQYSDVSAGGYGITFAGLVGEKAGDYSVTNMVIPATLTVTPAPLMVAADGQTKVYGQVNPALAGTSTGLLDGDSVTPVFSTASGQFSDVTPGGYAITFAGLSGAKAMDYSIAVEGGSATPATLNITPAPITVTAADVSKVYGQVNPTLTGTTSGLLDGDAVTLIFATTADSRSDVASGGYAINLAGLAGPKAKDYSTAVVGGSTTSGMLTITPAPISIAANSVTKVYGQANPVLSGVISGLLNGDSITPEFSTTAGQFSDVTPGGYAVTESGLLGGKAVDYRVANTTPGMLTVTPAPLTITADPATKVYGQLNPGFAGTVAGVFNNDDVTASYSTAATQFSDVTPGGYAITPTGVTGGKAEDYSLQVAGALAVPALLKVTPVSLMVITSDASKIYGQPVPVFSGTVTGILDGDDVRPTYTTSATASSDVNPDGYVIDVAGLSGTKSLDYLVATSIPATLTVTPAALTVTADATSKVYGQANPAFTASYSGFVLGQDPTALGGTLGFTTDATAASHVGTDAVSVGGVSSPDYAISFVGGTLGITPAPLNVTVVDVLKDYGQAVPTLSASYSGFVNGDTAAGLATPVSLTTPATAATHFGVYPIAGSGAVSGDYVISYTDGAIAVTPAMLTVTPVDVILDSGASVPPLTASYSGFVNSDTAATLTSPVTLSTSATARSPVGVYPITVSGGSSPDYSIVANPGAIAITPSSTVIPVVPGQGAFVTSLFETILGREPETSGLSYWLAQLSDGTTEQAVANDIYGSREAVTDRSHHKGTAISEPKAFAAALKAQATA